MGGWGRRKSTTVPQQPDKQTQRTQQVKIQKVIKKKYVINPYSSIIMSVRKIDDVKINVNKMTHNLYTIGQGSGDGARATAART